MRGVILVKCIIEDSDPQSFYRMMGDVIERLEEVGQENGEADAVVMADEFVLPEFDLKYDRAERDARHVVELENLEAAPVLEDSSFLLMLARLKNDEDPYTAMAAARFKKPIDQVTPEERQEAKKRVLIALYDNLNTGPVTTRGKGAITNAVPLR